MFTYNEYKNIIGIVQNYLPIIDFSEVKEDTEKFCVLRHDIEFSVDRALTMARIETDDLDVKSTYTVQLRNNTYNALSQKNISKNTDLYENVLSYPLKEAREKFEKDYLTSQLKIHKGNISKTAEFIGMERSALHRKLKTLGIKGVN